MGSLVKKLFFLFSQWRFVKNMIVGAAILGVAALLGIPDLLALIIAFLVLTSYIIAPFLSVRPKQLATVADHFIEEILDDTSKEFCLILRPFGADGDTIIRSYTFNSSSGRQKDRFAPFKIPKTVEQVIVKVVNNLFRCETVALVDPNTRVISNSPTYLAADNNSWQFTIDLLLRRTLVAFLILHPEQQLTRSVMWEVDRVVSLGLLKRFVIVLPPPDRPEYMDAYETLRQLQRIFPALQCVPFGAFVVLPYPFDTVRYWFRLHVSGGEVNEATYVSALNQCLIEVMNNALRSPQLVRYPYWNKRIRSIKLERK